MQHYCEGKKTWTIGVGSNHYGRGQTTEDGKRQRTDDRGQVTEEREERKEKREDRRQKTGKRQEREDRK